LGDYAALIHQSDELRDYLRCELPLPDDTKPSEVPEQYMNILGEHLNRVFRDVQG